MAAQSPDMAPDSDAPVGDIDEGPTEPEPNTTGTVFLTLVFLMMCFGMWVVMYIMLLNR